MRQVFIKKGKAVVEDVPAPCVQPGMIFVKTCNSCISIGTEMSSVKSTSRPLWQRALDNPDQVKKAIKMMRTQGLKRTRKVVEGRLAAGNPVGYSSSGVVLEVGEGVDGFKPGDRVACAGAGYASHAEFIVVPPNLTVKIPEGLGCPEASTVALGSIALQGVRRANPTCGEIFVVLGLGILGQLTMQILLNSDCRVIGTDIDPKRGEIASGLGVDYFISSKNGDVIEQVFRLADGYGADGAIITAATPTSDVVSQAFKMCRRKGRVVLVGDVGLQLNRGDFYSKEIDFLISTSYGPGRYDSNYEERGLDYPIAYVRWTENRNMGHFLQLLASGKVKVSPLIHKVFPIDEAPAAYEILKNGEEKPLMVLLSYPEANKEKDDSLLRVIPSPLSIKRVNDGQVRLALVGAGGFAKAMHLPNIQGLPKLFQLKAVISRSGHNAKNTAIQYKAEYSGTDYHDVLKDPEIDAVLIATRHNLHASMVLEALKVGKHVLVEKPLCLTEEELSKIVEAYSAIRNPESAIPLLMVGFNRRFSPYIKAIAEEVRNRTNPMIINYRMNAGYIPLDHWIHSEEGGGRNRGEACHIYDVFGYIIGAEIFTVKAFPIYPTTGYYSSRDNFTAVISFKDGSVASLTYTALGSGEYPKELMEVYVDGKIINLIDYKRLEFHGTRSKPIKTKFFEKGHKEELVAFANSVLTGGEWPIPLWQQIQVTEIALRVEELLSAQHAQGQK